MFTRSASILVLVLVLRAKVLVLVSVLRAEILVLVLRATVLVLSWSCYCWSWLHPCHYVPRLANYGQPLPTLPKFPSTQTRIGCRYLLTESTNDNFAYKIVIIKQNYISRRAFNDTSICCTQNDQKYFSICWHALLSNHRNTNNKHLQLQGHSSSFITYRIGTLGAGS